MIPRANPNETSEREAVDKVSSAFIRRGTTSSVPTSQNDGNHGAFVQELSVAADKALPVIPQVHGDFYVPPENVPVAIAPYSHNEYAVIGAPVPKTATPTVEPGERILSHPLSGANIFFQQDGTIIINSDGGAKVEYNANGNVIINDGTEGAITNVEAGARNSNNGITELDITREQSILI